MSIYNLTRTYQNTWPEKTIEGTLRLKPAASTINEGILKITPILTNGDSPFGAEIEGIDWSSPIPEALVQEVRNQKVDKERECSLLVAGTTTKQIRRIDLS